MSGSERRIELSVRTIVLAALTVVVAVVVLWSLRRANRVLGWVATAAVLAALGDPVVRRLTPRLRRGGAVAVVMLSATAVVVALSTAIAGDVASQYNRLREAAPEATAAVEQSNRLGAAARRFQLTERVDTFLADLPDNLAGGEGEGLVRSAATRGIATFITGILTLFLLLDGERLVRSGLRQVRPDRRRRWLSGVLLRAHVRWRRYWGLMVPKAIVVGALCYAGYRGAGLPAASVLALSAGALSLVPHLGLVFAGFAVGALAGGVEQSFVWAGVAWAAHLALQLADSLVLRRVVHPRTFAVGPAVSLLAILVGFEVYGLGGAVIALPTAAFGLAVLDEWLPDAVDHAPDTTPHPALP